jgi:putative ABC transport system substrate-binding protein
MRRRAAEHPCKITRRDARPPRGSTGIDGVSAWYFPASRSPVAATDNKRGVQDNLPTWTPPIAPRCVLLLCLALLALVAAATVRAQPIDLILSEEGGVYDEVRDVLRQELGGRAELNVLTAAEASSRGSKSDAQLVITVGVQAFEAAARQPAKSPVLGTLLPRAAYERIVHAADAAARPATAIYLDQPAARQLNLVRLVTPGRDMLGFLVSPQSESMLAPFQAAARDQKLVVTAEQVTASDDLYGALRRLLGESEVIVALPDSAIFNAGTIVNILITTYRAQEPLFAFSPAYVKAGALAAVYSSPRQVALEAADWVKRYAAASPLPAPQYPRQFSVAVNQTVAHSLGINVDDEATVLDKLRKMEHE